MFADGRLPLQLGCGENVGDGRTGFGIHVERVGGPEFRNIIMSSTEIYSDFC